MLQSVETLERKEYIVSESGLSEKRLPIKLHILANKGLDYVLMNSHDLTQEEIDIIIENYSENKQTAKALKDMHEYLGTPLALKVLKTSARVNKFGKQEASVVLMSFTMGLTEEERKRLDDYAKNTIWSNREVKKGVTNFLKEHHLI